MAGGQTSAGGASPLRIVADIVAALALAGVLLGVLGVDFILARNATPTSSDVVAPLQVSEVDGIKQEETVQPIRLRLAVTAADFDDMGRLLRQLGEGYAYDTLPLDAILDPQQLSRYDVLFLTCGGAPEHWLDEAIGDGARDSKVFTVKPEVGERMRGALRQFVENGGTLYASDWRYQELRIAFRELIDRSLETTGDRQELEADVVDDGLREVLGDRIPLNFDLPGWYPATFRDNHMTTYLKGAFRTLDGGRATAPLLVRIPVGKGSIIFTSFHNEAVNSEIETKLLKYLVFTTVTARVQSQVTQTMVQGGFSPQKQNLLSASPDNPSVSHAYVNDKPGELQFVLAFENQGAKLRLEVFSPDGQRFDVREGSSTLRIDVPSAAQGSWKYTVTALQVPFANFPFTLTVGHKP